MFGLEMGTERAHGMLGRHFASAAVGKRTMLIDKTCRLAEAAAARRYAEEEKPIGRVLLIA